MKNKMRDLFLAVAGMIFIISAAVIFTVAFKPLYYIDVNRMDLAHITGYDKEVICSEYDTLIDYNLSPFQKELTFQTFTMSEEARIHFEEVKVIFQGFLTALIISAVIFLPTLIRKRKKRDLAYLRLTGVLSIGFPLLLGSLVAVNWERAFLLFHEMAFDNDYWLFDPVTDPIIDCLPDEFFLHCAVMILVLIFAASLICIVFGKTVTPKRNEEGEL